jgi:hypothetical protein
MTEVKSIEFVFENTEGLILPADIIDFRLRHITESAYLSHAQKDSADESFPKVAGDGYIKIRKDWFPILAARAITAARQQATDPLVARTFASLYFMDRDTKEWVADRLPDDEVIQRIVERLTSHFVQITSCDLMYLTLMTPGQPNRQYGLPWEEIESDDPQYWGDNQYAVNLETPEHFVILFDGDDLHIQDHGREKAQELGISGF